MQPWSDVAAEERFSPIDSFDDDYIEEKTRRVIADCHRKQGWYVADPSLWITAIVGRGGGKTTGQKARFILRMLRTPQARCVYIATTRVQAEILLWGPLKDTLERLGFQVGRDVTFNETKLLCTFTRNRARLRLVGADDKREIDKLRGQPFHEVCIDEAASFPPALLDNLIDRIISPRLGDFNGTLCMIGTPGHDLRGQFYDATRPGAVHDDGTPIHRPWEERHLPEFADWKGWSSHSWSLDDPDAQKIPALRSIWARDLEIKARNRWGDDHPIWVREYLGRWAADDSENVFKYRPHDAEGNPWNQWDPERVGPLKFAKLPDGLDWNYVLGMDLGHADPFALVVLAFSPSDPTRTIYHVFEFAKTKMYARTIAELLIGPGLDAHRPSGVLGVTGWPDGMVADLAGLGDTLLDELREVYGIRIAAAEKGFKYKAPAIELCNGDLVDGRIKILKGSMLEKEMVQLQWVVDEYGRLTENKAQANHCLVAGTMVATPDGERPIESVATGDYVMTRSGPRRVISAFQVGERETMSVRLPNGRTLTGTPDHRVLTADGWLPLELLTRHDTFTEWASTDLASPSSSMAKNIVDTRTEAIYPCSGTSPHPTASSFIAPSGRTRMDLLLQGCMSIIGTGIARTMTSTTLKPSTDENISALICERQKPASDLGGIYSNPRSLPRSNGTAATPASHGIASMPLDRSLDVLNVRATIAARRSSLAQSPRNDVAPHANDSHTTHGCAPSTLALVFDLSVEGEHEFYANGVLVSNCSDALIYSRLVISKLFESGNVVSRAPRQKLLRNREPDEPTEKVTDGDIESMLAEPEFKDPWDDD